MTEGSLDKCPIYDDVTSFVPTGPASGAEAVSAGWPCQVAASVSTRWHGWFVNFFNPLAVLKFAQGISSAGSQHGMADGRSSLIKHVFAIFDKLPRGPDAKKFPLCSITLPCSNFEPFAVQ